MKVTSSTGVGSATSARGASRPAGGFAVPQAEAAAEVSHVGPTAGLTGVASIDALLAMQSVGGPLERKRKAVSRAGRILDILEDVRVALIDGEVSPEALERLTAAVREERGDTEDPKLEGVLDEIETRAAVEAAKLEVSRRAA